MLVGTGYAGGIGLIVKGFASQTANLQEWQNSGGTILSRIGPAGNARIGGANGLGTGITSASLGVGSVDFSWNVLVVKGGATQTGDLTQWQNSAGTALASVSSAGNLNIGSTTYDSAYASKAQISSTFYAMSSNAPIGGLYLLSSDAVAADIGGMVSFGGLYSGSAQTRWAAIGGLKENATSGEYGGYLSLGTRTNGASGVTERMRINSAGNVLINGFTASTVGLTVKAAASQTANIVEFQTSNGSPMFFMLPSGNSVFYTALSVNQSNSASVGANNGIGAFEVKGTSFMRPINATGIVLITRGAASQTADLQQWQDSAGTVLAKITSTGDATLGYAYVSGLRDVNGTGAYLNMQASTSGILVNTRAAANVGLVIKGAASQTANFQEWQNSSGSVLASISSNGAFATAQGIVATGNYASSFGGGVIGGVIVTVKANSASNKALVIQGAASQTANLQEWQNSSGTVLSKIDSKGVLTSNVAFGDFWGPIWETVTAGSNDQSWKKLVVISLPDNNYSGIQFKIDINNAVTNFGSSAYPEKSTYTVAATRAGGTLNDSLTMTITGPEGDKYIRGMKLSNGTYEIQFRQPSDWTEVVVRVKPISAQPYLRGLSDLYTFYPMSAGGTAASTGGTVYTPVVGGTDKFSFLSAQSFAKIGGTSSQFLKADGSVDASTYMTTAMPYVAGHHAEGRYLASAALMNDLGNARLRGSTFTFTNVSPTNAQIDTMFDGTAGVVVWTTSGITFPVVIEFTLPRTLQYGATVGVGFGNATWRANSVKIEAFSNGAWVTCIDTTTNTSEDVIANIPGSNATPGTTKLRYTFADPNASQFRICHLWGFNYHSDMWTQLQMPRAGGTMYGSLAVQGYTQTLGTTNVVQNVIRGVSGQTSNLAEWQNSAGSVVASIAPDGTSTLGSLYITAGTHKIYGPVEVLTNSSGNANLSLIGFGVSSSTNLTIGIKNTDSVNNRNWQLIVGGGNYSGQSGNWIGEGGLIFQENNPNDSSQVVRGGFRRGGQFALGGANTYSASLSITPLSTSTIGQVVRANASQTASLQEWQLSDGSAAYTIDSNGHMFAGASKGLYLNTGYISGTRFAIASISASQIGMIIRGNTSQTGNLTEWRNVSDTVLASIDANGQGAFKSTTLTASSSGGTALTLVAASGQTAPLLSTAGGAKITAGGNYFEAPGIQSNYIMTATAGNSTIVPLTVYGAASQTANLQEWKDSTGTLLSAVSNVGTVRSPIFASTTSGVTYIATNFDTSGIAILTNGAAMKGLVIRGVASQTASLQEWQDSTGTLLGRFHPTAGLLIGGVSNINGGGAPYMNFGTTNFSLYSNTASNIGLIIKGAASQTANLQEWQNSAGTVLAYVNASGDGIFSNAVTTNDIKAYYGKISSNAQALGVSLGQISAIISSASTIGLVIRGTTSQSANLQEWQNSAGSILTSISATGKLTITNTSAADSLIEANGAGGGQFSVSAYGGISTNAGLQSIGASSYFGGYGGTSNVVVNVTGASGQTGDLQRWTNFAGVTLAQITASGSLELNGKDIELMNIMGAF